MRSRISLRPLLAVAFAIAVLSAAACSSGQAQVATEDAAGGSLEPSSASTIGLTAGQAVDIVSPASPPAIAGDAPAVLPEIAPALDLDPDAVVAAQEQVLAGIYDAVLPSAVHVLTTLDADSAVGERGRFGSPFGDLPVPPDRFFQRGEGSGFVWDEQGHIVTNQHVVANADRVTVEFADGTELDAEIVGGDPNSDIAVLKIEPPPGGLTPVAVGDNGTVRVGQMAITIGSPFGQDFSMTSGIVSALGRTRPSGMTNYSIPLVIQHDAAINPGNSGGPLLDRHGRVIGVNTQIISQTGTSAGIGFAVPINIVKRVVPALIADGEYRYAWLGISGVDLFQELREEAGLPSGIRGVLVQTVAADGPADRAGLTAGDKQTQLGGGTYSLGGDTIVAIEDVPVHQMSDLINYLAEHTDPGDVVTLAVVRAGGESADVTVTLAARP